MNLPPFVLGTHCVELRGGEFRFESSDDVRLVIPALTDAGHAARISFRDYRNREWVRIEGDVMIIRKGYRWNGASPKRWVLFRWVGTPDFPGTLLATLVHDVCFQFFRTYYWPEALGFVASNTLFQQIMKAAGFRWFNTYHGAVRDFGKLFTDEYPRRGEYSVLLP